MPPPPNLPPPPSSGLPPAPRHPLQSVKNVANRGPTTSPRYRPLVYALGIAGIAGSGALIGAILKMNEQDKSQKTQPLSGSQQQQPPPREVDYRQAIQTLETKRGHLIQQKVQLERKIQDLRQSQKLQAEEEQSKKELNLKR
ncbi:hypothetical protein LTR99_000598 [Exophiala xenobiotica]|uniref:Uncharacterized protein n=1 Tax=Vermiconidia calcicola TaxID=1690605 RepID=A0AAV9QJF6_9PEZI|nr:hypothetical protein LTR96_000746 [Exophiala xenobiotica]KAK5543579.1 hypothetical protein LTR25_001193 [Vermiconidia calcicola]KAK5548242.1 hypothetical protein LTR23_001951 [Chaetothyriales sp. CCFEE 6169]KAK5307626.1 hypothetical protein LTR99_000598 [Exophiala xenobiotica]KAK5343474.1 hypothetical protein LTR98_001103 [Exophiala xenobiotica]